MPYRGKGDAAPVANRLTELNNDLWASHKMLERRLDEIERACNVAVAIYVGVLSRDEAARLLARTDARTVSRVITEVAHERAEGLIADARGEATATVTTDGASGRSLRTGKAGLTGVLEDIGPR